MSEQRTRGKGWRILATVWLGLAVVFTLMGGAGSSCVALGATRWASMAALAPYQWAYQILVVLTLAAGLAGVWITIRLARHGGRAYRSAVAVLVVSAVLAGVQMALSESLRGKSAPNNMRFYFCLAVLALFLLLRLPPIWRRWGKPADSAGPASGAALLVMGLAMATTPWWMASSHTFQGQNWAAALLLPMLLAGVGLCLAGLGLLLQARAFGEAMPGTRQRRPHTGAGESRTH